MWGRNWKRRLEWHPAAGRLGGWSRMDLMAKACSHQRPREPITCRALQEVSPWWGNIRFTALLDSRVAKGAHGKGRSSAKALRPPVCRGCAYTIAGGLYPAYGFAPTRLNTADAPTRDRSLPASAVHSIIDFLSARQISELHAHQFSRAAAGWIRLYILATFCLCPGERCQPDSATHSFGFWIFLVSVILFSRSWICPDHCPKALTILDLDFSSCLQGRRL